MVPRISMIVGLDTQGSVFLTLVQANSNSKIMELYLHQLVKTLDEERPGWRQNTLLMWDNAPYHSSPATLAILEKLKVPVHFTGPHSYDASPCELFFAHFKKEDINPQRLTTGKSNFDNVVRLAVQRARAIPRVHRVLFWHHCLLSLYEYLTFKTL